MQEIFYFCGAGAEISNKRRVEESTAATIRDNDPDPEAFTALVGEGGVLAPGALPAIGGLSAEGEKAIHESLGCEVVKAKKPPKTPKPKEEAQELKPSTMKEKAIASLPDVLKKATEARKHALQLKHLSYSGELVQGLMKFSEDMEKCFEDTTKLQTDKCEEENKFEKKWKHMQERLEWYKNAEVKWVGWGGAATQC